MSVLDGCRAQAFGGLTEALFGLKRTTCQKKTEHRCKHAMRAVERWEYLYALRSGTHSRADFIEHSWEGDGLAYMLEPTNPGQRALETHSETSVEPSRIDVYPDTNGRRLLEGHVL